MTRSILVRKVQAELGDVPFITVKRIVDAFLDNIQASLRRGENIRISGFGNFTPVYRRKRMGRNPRTGAPAMIQPHMGVKFTVSKSLKNYINQK